MSADDYTIIKRQVAKLRASLADRIYAISEPADRIDEEAHAMALPANEETISEEENDNDNT